MIVLDAVVILETIDDAVDDGYYLLAMKAMMATFTNLR